MKMKSILGNVILVGVFLCGSFEVNGMYESNEEGIYNSSPLEESIAPEVDAAPYQSEAGISSDEAFAASICAIEASSLLNENQKLSVIRSILSLISEDERKDEVLKLCDEKIPSSEKNNHISFIDRVNKITEEPIVVNEEQAKSSSMRGQFSPRPNEGRSRTARPRRGRR
jgi:hypothetical protein